MNPIKFSEQHQWLWLNAELNSRNHRVCNCAPMSGKILKVNQMLLLEPEKIMQDLLGQG